MTRSALVLTACLLACAAAPASAMGPLEFNLTAGLDFSGEISNGDAFDTDTGYSLGLEVVFDFPLIDVGVGAEYGFDRGVDGDVDLFDDDVSSTNLYLVGRVQLVTFVYLVGRYGYGEFDGVEGLDGGESWAVGAGLNVLNKLRVEVLLNNASAEVENVDFDYESYAARLIYSF